MKAYAVFLLCLLCIAMSFLTYLKGMEINRLRSHQPVIEILKDPNNGDIYLRADGKHYYWFENACQTVTT